MAIVAGANGVVYQYYNPNMITFTENERINYHNIIGKSIQMGTDIDRAHKEVYDTLNVSYEIIEGSDKL